jgi:hypothetical protein
MLQTTHNPPIAYAGQNQTGPVGSTVQLDGSGSQDLDGNPLTYSWSFTSVPAGSTVSLSSVTDVKPTFVIDKFGTYVVQLIVADQFLSSMPSTVTVMTVHTPPVANAGPNESVRTGATVTLDGSASSDADGFPLTYGWSLTSVPQGSTAALTGAANAQVTFTADLDGTYIVQLIVNDGFNSSVSATATITSATVDINSSLAAVEQMFNSLPGQDLGADAQSMLKFLQSRPEFFATGLGPSSRTVWGTFADGQQLAVVFDGKPPQGSTSAQQPRAPRRRRQEQQRLKKNLPAQAVPPLLCLPQTEIPVGDIPHSTEARILDALGDPLGATGSIEWMLTNAGYSIVSADASVDSLMTVNQNGAEGILYISSHGIGYNVMTATKMSKENEAKYRNDLDARPPRLTYMGGKTAHTMQSHEIS